MKFQANLRTALAASALLALPLLAFAQEGSDRDRDVDRDAKRGEEHREYLDHSSSKYSVDARIYIANDNDSGAPTLLGRVPTKGTLSFVGVGQVLNGRYGTTRLDGVKFGFFGRSTGEWRKGAKNDSLSLYLDESSTMEQRRAMGALFREADFFRSEGLSMLATTKIDIDKPTTEPLGVVRCKIGERGNFSITPLKGVDGKNPIAIVNAYSYLPDREGVQLATSQCHFKDQGREVKITNGSGEIHLVNFEGTVGSVEEEHRLESRTDEPREEPRTDERRTEEKSRRD